MQSTSTRNLNRLSGLAMLVIWLSGSFAPAASVPVRAGQPPEDTSGHTAFLPNLSAQYPWENLTAWTSMAFQADQIRDLEVGPKPGWVWVLTYNGLYRSTNYGRHWQSAMTGIVGMPARFAVPEIDSSEQPLLASVAGFIYKSDNGGETWEYETDLTFYIQSLHYVDETAFAVEGSMFQVDNKVYQRISTNIWEQVGGLVGGGVNDLGWYQSTLYAGTNNGLYRLDGNTWVPVPLPEYYVQQQANWVTDWMKPVTVSQTNPLADTISVNTILATGDSLYLGTTGGRGVYRTTDGVNWTVGDFGITQPYNHYIKKLVASSNGWIFAAGGDGVFVSQDQGQHWQNLDQGLLLSTTAYGNLLQGINSDFLEIIREDDNAITLGSVFNLIGLHYLTVSDQALMKPIPPQQPPKAVLVVGPIDPPSHATTYSYIAWADRLAAIMEQHGMQVVRVYWPNSTWENVRAAIGGASLVVYKGHGFGIGDLLGEPTEMYGGLNGFCLVHPTDPDGARLGTQDMLVSTNRLAENAVVFFFCCSCAGASAADPTPVEEALAKHRIEAYASTSLHMGGIGYFSGVDEQGILGDLFAYPDKTLGEIYASHGGAPDHMYSHVLWPEISVWFDGDTQEGWGRAFVGNPDFRAGDIWAP